MWWMTTIGFFSVVRKSGESGLTVRSRVCADLDRLRHAYLPELGPTQAGAGTDYPYRAHTTHEAFARASAAIVHDIDYSNFKNEVAAKLGSDRAHAYHDVWTALLKLEKSEPPAASRSRRGRPVAYGGVVVNRAGQVLLREPAGHFGGYVWTFPKGRPEDGETPEQTALREVQEEVGVVATIRCAISEWFEGDTSDTQFFLMDFVEEVGPPCSETSSICWVSFDEARARIAETRSPIGRRRDIAVLEAARDAIAATRSA